MNCTYCETETEGYFKLGRETKLLKVPCCEKCYDTLIDPLPKDQKNIMAEMTNILVWRDIDCDFEEK